MPPRWRVPLLVLGFASLAFGVAGGLVRLGASIPAPAGAIALHGALMVSGFLGTVIGLELSRYLKRTPAVRSYFLVLAILLLISPLAPRLMGVVLSLLALWLFAFDLARVTVRQNGLPRYVAVCLLSGYVWLALGGVLLAAEVAYDAALHAIFVGFVFSMVFGHAPVILPAVLRVSFPYHPVLYLPLALLHASLAIRVFVSPSAGAWGNAAAIVFFIITGALLVLRRRERRS